MMVHLAAWAALTWFALVFTSALLPVVSQIDKERRSAPLRSRRRYGLILLAAVLEATGVAALAVGMFAAVAFIVTAARTFLQ